VPGDAIVGRISMPALIMFGEDLTDEMTQGSSDTILPASAHARARRASALPARLSGKIGAVVECQRSRRDGKREIDREAPE